MFEIPHLWTIVKQYCVNSSWYILYLTATGKICWLVADFKYAGGQLKSKHNWKYVRCYLLNIKNRNFSGSGHGSSLPQIILK
jgi:hypothetical protein